MALLDRITLRSFLPCSLGAIVALGVVAFSHGCSDGTAAISEDLYTAIYVDQADLNATASCTTLAGGMQSYSAMLTDITPPYPGEVRPIIYPTKPISCDLRAFFGQVELGHYYVGEIKAYDRPACNTPNENLDDAGASSNDDTQDCVHAASDWESMPEPVWHYKCGDPDLIRYDDAGYAYYADAGDGGLPDGGLARVPDPQMPTTPLYLAQVKLRGCALVKGPKDPVYTVVVPTALPEGFVCKGAASNSGQNTGASGSSGSAGSSASAGSSGSSGTAGSNGVADIVVGSMRVTPDVSTLSPVTVDCGENATFTLKNPNVSVTFKVEYFEADTGALLFGTQCHGVSQAKGPVYAVCDEVSTQGGIRVPTSSAFTSCDGLASVSGSVVSAGATAGPVACGEDLVFKGIGSGLQTVAVTSKLASGEAGPSTICQGLVTPGVTVTAACDLAQLPIS